MYANIALLLAYALSIPAMAHATLIWDGDASQGTDVFEGVECVSPTSLTVIEDSSHGPIFQYDKSAGSIRCESRGISVDGETYTFSEDSTYYLGWQNKLNTVTGDFVVWQWKSYPNSEQNYPLIMTVKDGSVRLFYSAPTDGDTESWTLLWSGSMPADKWNSFALGIHTSSSATDGWVELWFNGSKQTLNGTDRFYGRTWDTLNKPKWGAYDRDDGSVEFINYVDGQKIGTTYADVS